MDIKNQSSGRYADLIDRAEKAVDGRGVLADLFGVKPSAVGNWKVRGVPVEHCARMEQVTHGAVTRQELRPDDWRTIWPELAEKVDAASTEPKEGA